MMEGEESLGLFGILRLGLVRIAVGGSERMLLELLAGLARPRTTYRIFGWVVSVHNNRMVMTGRAKWDNGI